MVEIESVTRNHWISSGTERREATNAGDGGVTDLLYFLLFCFLYKFNLIHSFL
jgi:hypothetical protein